MITYTEVLMLTLKIDSFDPYLLFRLQKMSFSNVILTVPELILRLIAIIPRFTSSYTVLLKQSSSFVLRQRSLMQIRRKWNPSFQI